MTKKKTNEEFISELKQINNQIIPNEPYTHSKVKILFTCKVCGYSWNATPNQVLTGNGCPNCAGNKKKTNDEFIAELKSINDQIVPLEPYNGSKGKILCKCEKCGYLWHSTPNRLLRGNGCPNCYDVPFGLINQNWDLIIASANANALKRSNEEFQQQLHKANPTVVLLDEYTSYLTKLHCKCSICGNEWDALPNSLLRGHACPVCGRSTTGAKNRLSNEEFISRLSETNPNIEPLELYEKGTKKISFRCKVCGYTWKATPQGILAGTGCPKCAKVDAFIPFRKPVKCIETGIIYESYYDARQKTGINTINKCAKGLQKTAGGYHWEYVLEKEP